MKNFLALVALCFVLLFPFTAQAQDSCPVGKVCVDEEDVPIFIEALKEKKCLATTPPDIMADPLTVVIDRQGRVYGSGSGPQPFKLHMTWCNYEVEAVGQTRIVSAQRVEPDWGFRFRPKATLGLLGTELVRGEKFTSTIDGGALIEPFYFHFVNINGYVGVRSVGGGVGFDLTRNFGFHLGMVATWDGWRANPFVSAYFSFL